MATIAAPAQSAAPSADPTSVAEDTYEALVASLLPPTWRRRREGERTIFWATRQPPADGWIIGLSATPAGAEPVLRMGAGLPPAGVAGLRLCVRGEQALRRSLAVDADRTVSGLLMEVLVADEAHFEPLLTTLCAASAQVTGPLPLGFTPTGPGSVVSYRHGVMHARRRLNVRGEVEDYLISPRTAAAAPAPVVPADEPPLLAGRFEVRSAVSFTNFGGTYLGRDRRTGEPVVITEARPHLGAPSAHGEAIDALRCEYAIFGTLAATDDVARPIAYIVDSGHEFLVREQRPGRTLRRLIVTANSLLLSDASEAQHAAYRTTVRSIARSLIAVLTNAQTRGVVVAALSLDDVQFDPARGAVSITKCSRARFAAHGDAEGDRQREAGLLTPTHGRALAEVLSQMLIPSVSIDAIGAAAWPALLAGACAENGLGAAFAEVLAALLAGKPVRAGRYAVLFDGSAEARGADRAVAAHDLAPGDLRDLAASTFGSVLRTALRHRDTGESAAGRDWAKHPFTLGYGIFGAWYAAAAAGLQPVVDQRDIEARDAEFNAPPGLLVGAAGRAWALCDIGLVDRARAALGEADAHPDRAVESGLSYGAAGIGLAHLRLFLATSDARHLESAHGYAHLLVRRARRTATGLRWTEPDGRSHLGLMRGGAGVALFFLYLHCLSADHAWLAAGRSALACERAAAHELVNGTLAFAREHGSSRIALPYLDAGTAGFGSVLLRYVELAGADALRTDLETCYRSTRHRYTVFLGWAHGRAGIANFHLDAAYFMPHESRHRANAQYVFDAVALHADRAPDGTTSFRGEDGRTAHDFAGGAAGIALVASRFARNLPTFPFLEQYGLRERMIQRTPPGVAAAARSTARECF